MIRIPLFQKYDVTATTDPVFGRFGPDLAGRKPVKTVGSSTTVTEAVSGDNALDQVGVGDEMSVNRDGTWDVVYLTAHASDASVTVDTAVNWATGPQGSVGRHYHFRKFLSGQTDSDGWINARMYDSVTIQWSVPTFNATSITLSFEGRIKGPQTTPITITTVTVTGTTVALNGEGSLRIPDEFDEVRLGALVNTDTGTNTLNAYALCRPRAIY